MIVSAPRILVDRRDQVANPALAVTYDPRHLATRCRHQLAADDEQPVVVAKDLALDHDLATPADASQLESTDYLFTRGEAYGDALTLIALERLDYDWPPNLLRNLPG